jgi:hypothetical protein
MKRVYHPTLPSWQDVPDGDVDSWVESGWLKSPAKKVEYGELPEVGSHPGIASVPVLEGVSRSARTTPATTTTTSGSAAGSAT